MWRLIVGLTVVAALSGIVEIGRMFPVPSAAAAGAPKCRKWCERRYPVTATAKAQKQQQKANRKYCRFVCDECQTTGRKPCTVRNGRGKPPTTYCTCGDSNACCPDARCKSEDGQCCPEGQHSWGPQGPCCSETADLCVGACCEPPNVCSVDGGCLPQCPSGEFNCEGLCCRNDQICTSDGCQDPVCSPSCEDLPGYTCCALGGGLAGDCFDLQKDRQNCGECNKPCQTNEVCRAGKCVAVCPGEVFTVACNGDAVPVPSCCTPEDKCCDGATQYFNGCFSPQQVSGYSGVEITSKDQIQCCYGGSVDSPGTVVALGCPVGHTCCFGNYSGATSRCCPPGTVCDPSTSSCAQVSSP